MRRTKAKPAATKTIERKEGYLYTRVSDKGQVGREAQEATGHDLFARMGIEVLGSFHDDLTGKSAERDDLGRLIAILKKRPTRAYVFADDVSRIARGIREYLDIRDRIAAAGGIVVSPKHGIFADDVEDEPRELFDAYFASKQRKENAAQTTRRMRGRCLDGHWCLQLPTGYKYRIKQSKNDRSEILRNPTLSEVTDDHPRS